MSHQSSYLDGSTYHRKYPYDDQHPQFSFSTLLAYITLSVALIYYIVINLGSSPSSVFDSLWGLLVYITPYRLITALQSSSVTYAGIGNDQPGDENKMQRRAAKSEALRSFLGFNGDGVLARLCHSTASLEPKGAQRPPGLGNWDNSCYQNSVIQALASLPSLAEYLDASNVDHKSDKESAGAIALCDTIQALNNPANGGKRLWTPHQLKSMSSWQQQDAQEYLSKVLEDVSRRTVIEHNTGLTSISKSIRPEDENSEKGCAGLGTQNEVHKTGSGVEPLETTLSCPSAKGAQNVPRLILQRMPMEGLLAQRVGCMRCRYTEGLSLIPFNCLTVPLGNDWLYDIRECLDDYTKLETIEGVECGKCTLLKCKEQLVILLREKQSEHTGSNLINPTEQSQELLALASQRLEAINTSLEDEDFADETLLKICKVSPKNRVTTTKSRQAVIARAPQTLVIHVNRSVFDERTGLQRKNQADVQFPDFLDLSTWCLGSRSYSPSETEKREKWDLDPGSSMLANKDLTHPGGAYNYSLRALITHYGRHENGHYTCYRKYPSSSNSDDSGDPGSTSKERWWRLSDETVEMVSGEEVLAQGDVFMLFYERTENTSSELSKCLLASAPEGPAMEIPNNSPQHKEGSETSAGDSVLGTMTPEAAVETSLTGSINEIEETLHDSPSSSSYPLTEGPPGESREITDSPSDDADHPSRRSQTDDTVTALPPKDSHKSTTAKLTDPPNIPLERTRSQSTCSLLDINTSSPPNNVLEPSMIISDENRHQGTNILMAH